MDPATFALGLRQIAQAIDNSTQPSQVVILGALRGLLVAIDRFRPPQRPLPPAPPTTYDIVPPKPEQRSFPGAHKEQKLKEQREKRKLEREEKGELLQKQKEIMHEITDPAARERALYKPEFNSIEDFVQYLDDMDRDTYTISERNALMEGLAGIREVQEELDKIKAQGIEPTKEHKRRVMDKVLPNHIKTEMQKWDKHLLLRPMGKIRTPDPVIQKAADLVGASLDDMRNFLLMFESTADMPVDSKPLAELYQAWIGGD